jgi:hypothetical protein
MARLPMSEMAAEGGPAPTAEAVHGTVHAVAMSAEMRVMFRVRETVSGEVAKKASAAETAVTAAKAVRRRIDLGQGEAKDNGSRNGD